jgi:cell wall-associated NlpC family hydrolase
MRFAAQFALLSVLAAALPAAQGQQSWAQQKLTQEDQPQGTETKSRRVYHPASDSRPRAAAPESLTTDERLAILGTVLDVRRRANLHSDCSHLIHTLYERAGFPYEYASSGDLYAGIDEFRRVTTPQPGDLVVWRGHAGIVTNPARHSFFSLLRSGPAVDSYNSPYWKRRGRPRFFRYVKTDSRGFRSSFLRTPNDF